MAFPPASVDPAAAIVLLLIFWTCAIFLPAHQVRIRAAADQLIIQRTLFPGWRRSRCIPISPSDILCMEYGNHGINMTSPEVRGGYIRLIQRGRKRTLFTNLRSNAECEHVYSFLQQRLGCAIMPYKK